MPDDEVDPESTGIGRFSDGLVHVYSMMKNPMSPHKSTPMCGADASYADTGHAYDLLCKSCITRLALLWAIDMLN
jgi:hypothetical protein